VPELNIACLCRKIVCLLASRCVTAREGILWYGAGHLLRRGRPYSQRIEGFTILPSLQLAGPVRPFWWKHPGCLRSLGPCWRVDVENEDFTCDRDWTV
jgi:hypothetical protein